MEIIIGVTLYLIVISGFMAFGRFIKECDEQIANGIKNQQEKKQ